MLQRKPVNQVVGKNFNESFFQLFISVKGIGKTINKKLLSRYGFKTSTKLNVLRTTARVQPVLIKAERLLENMNFSLGDVLKREVENNIIEKVKHGTVQGQLFVKGLPIHNQRTKTNASTSKGQRQMRQVYASRASEGKRVSPQQKKSKRVHKK